MGAYVYIVRCNDGKYYVGTTRDSLELRIAQHNDGTFDGFTSHRRPVALVYSEYFEQITDAITAERKLKGWSRTKKEALIDGEIDRLRNCQKIGKRNLVLRQAQDEVSTTALMLSLSKHER